MKKLISITVFLALKANGKVFGFIDDIWKKREEKARDEWVAKNGSLFDLADQQLMKENKAIEEMYEDLEDVSDIPQFQRELAYASPATGYPPGKEPKEYEMKYLGKIPDSLVDVSDDIDA